MTRMQAKAVRMVRPAPPSAWLRAWLVAWVLALAAGAPAWSAGPAQSSDVMVNINTASAEELQALPGVGESRAAQIVALRKERGAFRSIDELLEVRGIGPAMLERLRPQVALSGKTRLGAAPAQATPARKDGR